MENDLLGLVEDRLASRRFASLAPVLPSWREDLKRLANDCPVGLYVRVAPATKDVAAIVSGLVPDGFAVMFWESEGVAAVVRLSSR